MFEEMVWANKEFPWLIRIFVFGIGACWGSFLNVVIYRTPLGKSVVFPGSRCGCGKPIAWFDNIPVLSWFLLRGRARCGDVLIATTAWSELRYFALVGSPSSDKIPAG